MVDGFETASFLSINTSDLVWQRLPTPAPSERSGSVLSSLSSRDPSPQPSLFRSSRPQSERGSIHEVYSRPTSPLPLTISPIDHQEDHIPEPAGQKTNAFFSSSFASAVPTPAPPPPPTFSHSHANGNAPNDQHVEDTPNSQVLTFSELRSKIDTTDSLPSEQSPSTAIETPRRTNSLQVPFGARFLTHLPRRLVRKSSGEFEEAHEYQLPSPTTPVPLHRDIVSLNDNLTPTATSVLPEQSIPLERPVQETHESSLEIGDTIGDDHTQLNLVRILGHGAFSTVWLATDENGTLGSCRPDERRKSHVFSRHKGERRVPGLRPPRSSHVSAPLHRQFTTVLHDDGVMTSLPSNEPEQLSPGGRLVAVKMMERTLLATNDRTRVSFVREREVLRHISHPCIVSYLHSFTTPTHHCLVLEYVHGGELFDLINSEQLYEKLTEPILRRMFGELSLAVGWMHGVGLVHRDIKLENILLTTDILSWDCVLDDPTPILKLTDFGLSRFIEPEAPLLSTRCGSESYAAPEMITSVKYDGRQTDAWACGIVLYALGASILPFEVNNSMSMETRRSVFLRIANADYAWPDPSPRLASEGLQKVAARLLVRDPTKRARIVDLWEEEWITGEGAPLPPASARKNHTNGQHGSSHDVGVVLDGDTIANVARQD